MYLQLVQEHVLQDVVDQLVDRNVAVLVPVDPDLLLGLLEDCFQHRHLLHRRGLVPVDVGVHRLKDLIPDLLLPLDWRPHDHPHEHDIHLGLRVVPHVLLDFLEGVHVPLVDVLKRNHRLHRDVVHVVGGRHFWYGRLAM